MTRKEAKTVFLNRGYIEVEGGTIYDPDKWREACVVISKWLEQEPILDKIRSKIITKHLKNIEHDDYSLGYSIALEEVLSIIDNEVNK